MHRDDDDDARDEFFFGVNRRCGSLGNVVGGEIRGGGEESVGKYATTRGSQRLGKKSKRRGGRAGERTSRDHVRRVVRGREDGVVVAFADAQREKPIVRFDYVLGNDENARSIQSWMKWKKRTLRSRRLQSCCTMASSTDI